MPVRRPNLHTTPAPSLRLCVALVLAVSLAAVNVAPSFAADPPGTEDLARDTAKEGVALAREGKFHEALDKFHEANRLSPSPLYQHNIARAYQKMGELRQAWEYFGQATKQEYRYKTAGITEMANVEKLLRQSHAQLEIVPTPSDSQVVITLSDATVEPPRYGSFKIWAPAGQTQVQALRTDYRDWHETLALVAGEERKLDVVLEPLPQLGHVLVNTNVDGAQVYLDDDLIGATPMNKAALHLTGVYRLRVVADGYLAHREDITIDQGATTERNIVLVSEAAADAAIQTGERSGPPKWVGYTVIGASVVTLGVGIYFHVDAIGFANEANAIQKSTPQKPDEEREFNRLFGIAKDQERNAIIAYSAAGALAITGGLLLYFSADDGPGTTDADTSWDSPPPTTFQPLVSAGPDGVGVGGLLRF